MENNIENNKKEASIFIENDYLNAYASITDLFARPQLIEEFKKEGTWPPKLKSFSERYQHMQLNITDSDREKINKLDELSIEANRLLAEPNIDIPSFLNLSVIAAETCNRPDTAEIFKKRIKE
jgi:hypothetical protein